MMITYCNYRVPIVRSTTSCPSTTPPFASATTMRSARVSLRLLSQRACRASQPSIITALRSLSTLRTSQIVATKRLQKGLVRPTIPLGRRSVFIQAVDTPNPESLKFVPTNMTVMEASSDGRTGYSCTSVDDPTVPRLAKQLLAIDGIKLVYLGADFVTITKLAQQKWKLLRPQVLTILMDWFERTNYQPMAYPQERNATTSNNTVVVDDDEIVELIHELMNARIRPAVQEDGGDIQFVEWDEATGIVKVQLEGSCVGCPSSSVTLKQGVENMLMHYIPEIKGVEAMEEDEDEAMMREIQPKPLKTYEQRLADAGIPFAD